MQNLKQEVDLDFDDIKVKLEEEYDQIEPIKEHIIKPKSKNTIYGFILCFISVGAFCFNMHLVKQLEINEINGFQLVLFRSIILLGQDMFYIWYKDLTIDFLIILEANLSIMLLRGVLGSLGMLMIWQIANLAPLGEITSILSLTTIYTPILAQQQLDEVIGKDFIIQILMTIVGICLIERPYFIFQYFEDDPSLHEFIADHYPRRQLGLNLTLFISLLPSIVQIILRKMKAIRSEQSTMSWALAGIIYSSMGLFFVDVKRIVEPKEWFILLILGIGGVVQQQTLAKSLQHTESYVYAVLSQFQVLVNFVGDQYIYGTKVYTSSYQGATFIVAVSIIIVGKKSFC